MEENNTAADNTKLFRKIVRNFNKEYGYNFVLPKDTDYSDKYAHPVHKEGDIVIKGQIDDGQTNQYIYGLTLVKDGLFLTVFSPEHDGVTYDRLMKAMSSSQFKYRLNVIKQLQDLADKLDSHINEVRGNLLTGTLHDIEKEDSYDLAIQTAKELYRSSPKGN